MRHTYPGTGVRRRATAITLALVLAVTGAGAAEGSATAAKKGKIRACVAKKGKDKGLMRYSRGKCKRGRSR